MHVVSWSLFFHLYKGCYLVWCGFSECQHGWCRFSWCLDFLNYVEQEGNREVAKLEGVKKREVASLGALAPGAAEQKPHKAARLEGLLVAKGLLPPQGSGRSCFPVTLLNSA